MSFLDLLQKTEAFTSQFMVVLRPNDLHISFIYFLDSILPSFLVFRPRWLVSSLRNSRIMVQSCKKRYFSVFF